MIRDLSTPLSATGSFKMDITEDSGVNYKKLQRQAKRRRRKNKRRGKTCGPKGCN